MSSWRQIIPLSTREKRSSILQAKLAALQDYKHKDRPESQTLLDLLVLDTTDVRLELQQLAWEALSGAVRFTVTVLFYIRWSDFTKCEPKALRTVPFMQKLPRYHSPFLQRFLHMQPRL